VFEDGDDDTTCPINGVDRCLIYYASMYALDSVELFDSARVYEKKYEISLMGAIRSDRKNPARKFKPRSDYSVDNRSIYNPFKGLQHG